MLVIILLAVILFAVLCYFVVRWMLKTPSTNSWKILEKKLSGQLILPTNPNYEIAHQLFIPLFDHIHPQGIAYCLSPADVQACIAFAQEHKIPLAVRAGGHSYAGYSTTTGLVVNLTHMNHVGMNPSNGQVVVGGGTSNIDLADGVTKYGRVIPSGTCPSVCIGGLTLGGGIGTLDRKFGLTCDNLLSVEVVLADGKIVNCDEKNNPDLFWASRGGGGGNFGVVTSFLFQSQPLERGTWFVLVWPWSSAKRMVQAWQNWAPHAPDEVWSSCQMLCVEKTKEPLARIVGVYAGDANSAKSLLGSFLSTISVAPISSDIQEKSVLEIVLFYAGCSDKTIEQCHVTTFSPEGQVARATYTGRSDFYTKLVSDEGIDTMIRNIEARHVNPLLTTGSILLDASGGAINRVPKNATAFVHRDALFSSQYLAEWKITDPSNVFNENYKWLDALWKSLRPYASGEAYQNYIDPNLPDWQQAYYGSNLERLKQVKAQYDPTNFFHFAQSIPLP